MKTKNLPVHVVFAVLDPSLGAGVLEGAGLARVDSV